MDSVEFIKKKLTEREILEQIAEEAAELAQAALKKIRTMKNTNNPTTITADEADGQLMAEAMDVLMAINIWTPVADLAKEVETHWKYDRWAKRIRQKEKQQEFPEKVIYLSGPITGHDNYKKYFYCAGRYLTTEKGKTILNPAVLPDGLQYSEYMDIDGAMQRCANATVVIKENGWEDSKGTKAEIQNAIEMHQPVYYMEQEENGKWIITK